MTTSTAARLLAGLVVVATATIGAGSAPIAALADGDTADAQTLAERHAPIVRVATQQHPCDGDGEPFAPMSVDVVLGNDDVLLRQAGVGDPVVRRAPEAADLFGRGPGFFIDFNGVSLEPDCTYEHDYRSYTRDTSPLVYAHVVAQPDQPSRLAVQYWFYWYYNDWNNKHESDWEFIQVLFEAGDVAEALTKDPLAVGYAQHEGGERADWDDPKLERVGDRPVVYASRGSHASYFESAVFLGRNGTEGFGCDTTAADVTELRPEVELLAHRVDDADDPQAWLAFTGRWGERGSGPFNGPTGPNTKRQWTHPVDWHDDLRAASVRIPGGDETNGTVLDTFCNVVDVVSNQVRAAQVSPVRPAILAVAAFFATRVLVRRTVWSATPPIPLRRRRHVGQVLRTSLASFVTSRGALLAIGAAYAPLALVVAFAGWARTFTTAQATAGVFTSLMVPAVTAVVVAYWHLEGRGDPRSLVRAVALVRSRAWALVTSVGLVLAIALVLLLTVIGIPLAVRQIVRYQFVVPVVTTEALSGRAALRRSAELVDGHWWRSAVPLAVLGLLSFAINSALQLGLLIALGGLPLWLYVAVTFLATGLVVPIVATAPVFLYGDAVARANGASFDDESSDTGRETARAAADAG